MKSSDATHIVLAGPVLTAALREFLDGQLTGAPVGLGTTPPLTTLVRALVRRGQRVTVCTLDPSVRQAVTLRGPRLTVRYGPFREHHHMRDGMRGEIAAVRGLIRAAQPDVVNAHWAYEYSLGALSTGHPTLITVHDWGPSIVRHSPIPYWFARQLMYFRSVRRAQALSAVSPYLQGKLARVARCAVSLTPNGLEPPQISHSPRRLNNDKPLIMTVNHGFQSLKNVTTLLRAFPLVRSVIPACRLLLVGRGYEHGGLAHEWARERGLADALRFAGHVEHERIFDLLDTVDMLVHPSLEEAFGLTLIEAMARGTPALGGQDSGAVPWVLDGGKAGPLVDVRSPVDLAAGIVAVLQDQGTWHRYSEAGRRNVLRRFCMDTIVDDYLDAYERLLSKRRS
jgi:glycosyltransferase involved in cell wall biosynthesis